MHEGISIINIIIANLFIYILRYHYGLFIKKDELYWHESKRSKGDFTKHKRHGHIRDMLKALRRDDERKVLRKNLDACQRIYDHLTSPKGRATYTKAYKMHVKWGSKAPVFDWYNYGSMCFTLIMAIHEMLLKGVDFQMDEFKGIVIHRIDPVKAGELNSASWNNYAFMLEKFLKKNEDRIYAGEFHDMAGRMGDPLNEGFGLIVDILPHIAKYLAAAAFILWLARTVAYYALKMRYDGQKIIETQRKYLEMHILTNRNVRSRQKQEEYIEYMKRMEKLFEIEEDDVKDKIEKHLEQEDKEIRDQSTKNNKNVKTDGNATELV